MLDDGEALEFGDRARSQRPDQEPETSGVRRSSSGGLLFTSVTETPALTAEMVNWWFCWRQLDPLRYTLWNPEDHFDVGIDDATRAHLLDQGVPVSECAWRTQCRVTESMNSEEPSTISLNFYDPGETAYDGSLLGTRGARCWSSLTAARRSAPWRCPSLWRRGCSAAPTAPTSGWGAA